MIKGVKVDKVVSIMSWVIVLALIYGAIAVWAFSANLTGGPVVAAFGVIGAKVIYSSVYGLEGLVLGYAKITKKNTLRTNTLLVIYLTGFFTSLLFILLAGGFFVGVIDNLVLATLAALCWLYWTLRIKNKL